MTETGEKWTNRYLRSNNMKAFDAKDRKPIKRSKKGEYIRNENTEKTKSMQNELARFE